MNVLKKILSIVIIILFIGIGIQPAFAVDTKTSTVNQQNEEDCGCQVVNRSNQVSSIICDILYTIFNNVEEMLLYYYEKAIEAEEAGNNLLVFFYFSLLFLYLRIWRIIYVTGCNLGCWGPP